MAIPTDCRRGSRQPVEVIYLSAVQAEVDEILTSGAPTFRLARRADRRGRRRTVLNPLLPAIFGMAFEDGASLDRCPARRSAQGCASGLVCAAQPLAAGGRGSSRR